MDILVEAKKLFKEKYGWASFFKENFHLIEKVVSVIEKKGGEFYPPARDVFRIYRKLRPEKIKVVILGQDPYHSENSDGLPVAIGYAFSVRQSEGQLSKLAPSLLNIFKVIEKTTGKKSICHPHGDLTAWVEQGVFLLNTSLTVIPGIAGSHGNIWEGFIRRTLAFISKRASSTPLEAIEDSDSESDDEEKGESFQIDRKFFPIALLWGAKAQAFKNEFQGEILTTSHPSPFSASRGFLDSDHFRMANKILISNSLTPINW